MRKTLTALAAVAALGISSAVSAAQVTIDFEGIAPANDFSFVAPSGIITKGDARLTASTDALVLSDGAATSFGFVSNGSDYYLDQVNGSFTIDTISGSSFDLLSFDIGDFDNPTGGGDQFSINVLGVYNGGGGFTDTLLFTPAGFITHVLNPSLYSGLTAIVFDIVFAQFAAFDNFVLDIQAANNGGGSGSGSGSTGVPVPGSMVLFGFGLLGLNALRRRTAA